MTGQGHVSDWRTLLGLSGRRGLGMFNLVRVALLPARVTVEWTINHFLFIERGHRVIVAGTRPFIMANMQLSH